jgi:hypothetical protein
MRPVAIFRRRSSVPPVTRTPARKRARLVRWLPVVMAVLLGGCDACGGSPYPTPLSVVPPLERKADAFNPDYRGSEGQYEDVEQPNGTTRAVCRPIPPRRPQHWIEQIPIALETQLYGSCFTYTNYEDLPPREHKRAKDDMRDAARGVARILGGGYDDLVARLIAGEQRVSTSADQQAGRPPAQFSDAEHCQPEADISGEAQFAGSACYLDALNAFVEEVRAAGLTCLAQVEYPCLPRRGLREIRAACHDVAACVIGRDAARVALRRLNRAQQAAFGLGFHYDVVAVLEAATEAEDNQLKRLNECESC